MNDPRIRQIIDELNQIAERRKQLYDELWMDEEKAQRLRQELNKRLQEIDDKGVKEDESDGK